MKLHQLRYFAVLAKELHYGRAAARLAITQPPLSAGIKALEEELGVKLFERSSKYVRLTPAGLAFAPEAERALEGVERAAETAKAVANGASGRLHVAISSGSIFYRELPAILERFGASCPRMEVVFDEISGAEQASAIAQGVVHAAFMNARDAPPHLSSLRLADDPFVLCVPSGSAPMDALPQSVARFAERQFIMFGRERAPANYDNVIAVFNRAGIHPRTAHSVRTWQTAVAMVANGLGVALVPSSLLKANTDGVDYLPIDDPDAASPALLAWDPSNRTAALRTFVACARDIVRASEPMRRSRIGTTATGYTR